MIHPPNKFTPIHIGERERAGRDERNKNNVLAIIILLLVYPPPLMSTWALVRSYCKAEARRCKRCQYLYEQQQEQERRFAEWMNTPQEVKDRMKAERGIWIWGIYHELDMIYMR